MSNKENSDNKISYTNTLNLPKTDLPIRSNPKVEDKQMIERWEKEELFKKSFDHNKGKEKFILHDGPPYANGHIHLGHAYNKILKDFVCKFQRMLGKQVPVTPGWDCHGLPIEFKVAQDNKGLSPFELKKKCREYALHWIGVQKEEFKNLGVLMNWKHPYLTMSPSYESSILKAFGIFVDQGYVERKNKTVPWCPSCQTVLATAEIEYADKKDPSVYVLFPLDPNDTKRLFPKLEDKVVNLLIWTTTPWTLPLNRAVLAKPDAHYVILEVNNTYVVVAKQLVDKLCALLGVQKNIIEEFSSKKFEGAKALHPFILNLIVPILLDQSVSLDDGTAFVHCAPGCGPEDYEIGIKNNLEIFSPISMDGKYTSGIEPKELEGMSVFGGQKWVIENLEVHHRLFFKTTLVHSYPHCWRCRGPLIFRATKQWFINLAKEGLRKKVLEYVDKIQMVPDTSSKRLKATLEGRLEWCISRQRIWGVPIVALLCKHCDYVYTNKKLIDNVAENFAEKGIEFWDTVDIKSLVQDISCPSCKKSDFKKETDILDVWFDSGVSHFAVLRNNPELQFPADIYLEGKDQHRGWFQSSLLTSGVLENEACTKAIVTHGFTVDELGKKMSKSLGNVVSPHDITEKLGTDGLRLWTSSIDLKDEAVVSEALLRNVKEVHNKIRNTCRFLLSNLYDFDIKKDAVAIDELLLIDKYALNRLYELNEKVKKNYKDYQFTGVFHEFANYCSKDLSAFYLDIIKDRLYVEKASGKNRRSAQTVCWYILDSLTKLMAPVLSFTAEVISDYYQKDKKESIHLQEFADLADLWIKLVNEIQSYPFYKSYLEKNPDQKNKNLKYWDQQWKLLIDIRDAILKAIEIKRGQGIIKHSLEAKITIYIDRNKKEIQQLEEFLNGLKSSDQSVKDFFKEFLIVSDFIIDDFDDEEDDEEFELSEFNGLYVLVDRSKYDKCPRCWQFTVTQGPLCDRCKSIVDSIQN